MRTENLPVSAAFGLSYADLTAGQQRLFVQLGLVPGPDFGAYATAGLDGTRLATARRYLDVSYDQHLLAEPARQAEDRLGEAEALAELGALQGETGNYLGRHRPLAGPRWRSMVTPMTCPARATPSTNQVELVVHGS